MALQTIGDLFFLICYIPGFYTYKGFTYSLTHELAQQLLLIFPTYMYFRELKI
ncbi:hypothetical protein HanPI659440_Chr04g0164151 [Helianthus annuus]|nr:hypothetical protein HanPI659440_Chr04g0164151 [Helianthus annuus]